MSIKFGRHINQVIGGISHSGDHDHHLMPGLTGLHNSARNPLQRLGVGNRGSAILLHNQCHLFPLYA